MTKEDFIVRLKELNLSTKDFSNIADISYSTIGNWGFKTNDKVIPVPKWVKPFLEHYCWDAKNLASARIHTWPADA